MCIYRMLRTVLGSGSGARERTVRHGRTPSGKNAMVCFSNPKTVASNEPCKSTILPSILKRGVSRSSCIIVPSNDLGLRVWLF